MEGKLCYFILLRWRELRDILCAMLMHIIFQRHHIPFDEFLSKPDWAQVLMLESMKIQLIAEQKAKDGTEEGGE